MGGPEAGRSGAAHPYARGHFVVFSWVQEAQAQLAEQGQHMRQTLAEAVAQRTVHDQMSAEAASQHADEMEKLRNEMRAALKVQLQRQLCEVQVEHQEQLQRQAAQHNEQTAELSAELQAKHGAQLQLQQRLDEAQATREPQAALVGEGGEIDQSVSCAAYIGSPDVGKWEPTSLSERKWLLLVSRDRLSSVAVGFSTCPTVGPDCDVATNCACGIAQSTVMYMPTPHRMLTLHFTAGGAFTAPVSESTLRSWQGDDAAAASRGEAHDGCPRLDPTAGADETDDAAAAEVQRAVASAVRECEMRLEVRHAEEVQTLQQELAHLSAHMQVPRSPTT